MDKELLAKYGIDYERGVKNCVGDSEFYKKLLTMFLKDECFPRARKAFAEKNYKELFSCVHELKGASGNAALNELYDNIVPLVDILRGGTDSVSEEKIAALFEAADKAYSRAYEGVSLAVAD